MVAAEQRNEIWCAILQASRFQSLNSKLQTLNFLRSWLPGSRGKSGANPARDNRCVILISVGNAVPGSINHRDACKNKGKAERITEPRGFVRREEVTKYRLHRSLTDEEFGRRRSHVHNGQFLDDVACLLANRNPAFGLVYQS